MRNAECYEAKLPEIMGIMDDEIIVSSSIPFEVFLQEADNLYDWCQADKEVFLKANKDWMIVEEIPIRAGALREAIARWTTQRFAKRDAVALWAGKSIELRELRNLLLHEFRYAYMKNTDICSCINAIAGINSHAALIQDLNDLSLLGKKNPAELAAINFDMSILDTAAQKAQEFAALYSSSTAAKESYFAKKIRDQAFTLLKRAMDEVCVFGRYAFYRNDTRKRGYTSSYLRGVRQKRANKAAKKKAE
jgi:hypothetical protein